MLGSHLGPTAQALNNKPALNIHQTVIILKSIGRATGLGLHVSVDLMDLGAIDTLSTKMIGRYDIDLSRQLFSLPRPLKNP